METLDLTDLVSSIEARVAYLLATQQRQVNSNQQSYDGEVVSRFTGAPRGTRRLTPSGYPPVFRHYTHGNTIRSIVSEGHLAPGKVPYAKCSQMSRAYWDDLKGVFLTAPEFSGRDVGVPDSKFFVDLQLDPRIPIIEIENGIYLIPTEHVIPIQINATNYLEF